MRASRPRSFGVPAEQCTIDYESKIEVTNGREASGIPACVSGAVPRAYGPQTLSFHPQFWKSLTEVGTYPNRCITLPTC